MTCSLNNFPAKYSSCSFFFAAFLRTSGDMLIKTKFLTKFASFAPIAATPDAPLTILSVGVSIAPIHEMTPVILFLFAIFLISSLRPAFFTTASKAIVSSRPSRDVAITKTSSSWSFFLTSLPTAPVPPRTNILGLAGGFISSILAKRIASSLAASSSIRLASSLEVFWTKISFSLSAFLVLAGAALGGTLLFATTFFSGTFITDLALSAAMASGVSAPAFWASLALLASIRSGERKLSLVTSKSANALSVGPKAVAIAADDARIDTNVRRSDECSEVSPS
mmetsp:Transcript_36835/g.42845  ORF Transcript_36835/g.42845 Transcript_36835/m.42845 type:complete len:281 (+) Transcript_36835:302-1144(+)